MSDRQIRIRATNEEIHRLRQQVEEEGIPADQVTWSERQPARRGLVDRQPLGQMEFFDIIITIGAGVASNAIYYQLNNVLKRFEGEGKVQVLDKTPEETRPPVDAAENVAK